MRVITGKFKGRRLRTVPDLSIRPATDKVKGAIFNILQSKIDWNGARVLDLFAGTGSVGIEALSRGAGRVVFVEHSRRAADVLRENLSRLNTGYECEVIQMDVFSFLGGAAQPFDIVFADPPYAFEELSELPGRIFRSGVVVPDGYLVIEHPSDLQFKADDGFSHVMGRKYGRTVVSLFQSSQPPEQS